MQKEPKDSFPSDTRKNPKDCVVVILRTGRESDERRGEKWDTKEDKQAEIGKELELDRMTTIEAKPDVVMNKLGNSERRMHTAHDVGSVKERNRISVEELVGEEPYQVEEAKYMNEQRSYHFKPNPIFPTHYTPALRNHENFSYGGGAQ